MKPHLTAGICGLAMALYLRFGLEPTGWLFYHLSHGLSMDWLYWGYSFFRGAAHLLSLWSYQNIACLVLGLVVFFLVWLKTKRNKTRQLP